MKSFGSIFVRNAINSLRHDPFYGVQNKNYYRALYESNKALESSAKTTESAAKALHSTGKVTVQTIATVAGFDYVAGKIVTTKALSGFVPSIPILSTVFNAAYKLLTTNPTAAFGATLAASLITHPEGAIGVIKNTGNFGYHGAKAGFHGLNSGLFWTKYALGDDNHKEHKAVASLVTEDEKDEDASLVHVAYSNDETDNTEGLNVNVPNYETELAGAIEDTLAAA
jgi:hypothetical protein